MGNNADSSTDRKFEIISLLMHGAASGQNPEKAILHMLDTLLTFYNARRAAVYLINEDQTASPAYSRCDHHTDPSLFDNSTISIGDMNAWIDSFHADECVFISDVSSLSGDRSVEKMHLLDLGIQSLMSAPLFLSGHLSGFVSAENFQINSDDLSILTTVRDMIIIQLSRNPEKISLPADLSSQQLGWICQNYDFILLINPDRSAQVLYSQVHYFKTNEIISDLQEEWNSFLPADMDSSAEQFPYLNLEETRSRLKDSESYSMNLSLAQKDQSVIFKRAVFRRIDPECRQILFTGNDITSEIHEDMAQAREWKNSLQKSETSLQTVIDHSGMIYWEYDLENDITYYGKQAQKALHVPAVMHNMPQAWIDTHIMAASYNETYIKMIQDLKNGVHQVSADLFSCYPSSGMPTWQRVVFTIITEKNGKPSKALGTATDITVQKNTEDRLTMMLKTASEPGGTVIALVVFNVNTGIISTYESSFMKLSPEELQTTSIQKLEKELAKTIIDETDRRKWTDMFSKKHLLQSFVSGKESFYMDLRCQLPDGSRIWARDTIRLLQDPSGPDIIAVGRLYDIDEIKLNEAVMSSVISDSYDCILSIRSSDGFFNVRYGLLKPGDMPFFSSARTELASHDLIKKLIDPEEQNEAMQNLFLSGIKKNLEHTDRFEHVYRMHINGKLHYKRNYYYYLDTEKSSIVSVWVDVTDLLEEEVKQKETLHQALQDAQNANAAKSEFLSRMSHDIRTPMNAIIGTTALAEDDIGDDSALKEDLQTIDSSSHFLLGLINDILDLSKIEAGQMTLNPEPYTYEEFYRSIENTIRPLMDQKKIHFQFLEHCTHECILTDKLRYSQIFFNLLSNAAKFTAPGGQVDFIIEAYPLDSRTLHMKHIVRDNGIGISESYMKHLFEPFTRDESNSSGHIEGTGLGLAIVKSIVDIMHGTIQVKSELGKGTEFTVILDMPITEAVKDTENDLSGTSDFSILKGQNILLADDNVINTVVASKLLEKTGCLTVPAGNGKEAVEKFSSSKENYYAAILMDIRMPVMDGLKAAEKIRTLDRSDAKTIPIIAMTADAFSSDIDRTFQAGMNAHLSKPIEPKKLYQTLTDLIGKEQK